MLNAQLRVVWQSRWGLPIGYAIHSEEMALALDALGVEVMHRATPLPVPAAPSHPALLAATGRPPRDDAPQISYDQADLFYLDHRGYKIGFTMLEVDGLPAEWVAACNRVDEVWVPSSFNRATFADSGVRRPIRIVPLGYNPDRFNPQLPSRRASARYTFLSVFEWGERKAPELLLRAYARAFSARDDVLLLLRVNNFDPTLDVAGEIAALGLPAGGPPVALLYNQQLAAEQLGSLYRAADCFVLPTRGEGWGMPILEAMACGLPAIATDWSGQAEFLNTHVAYPLRVRSLVPAVARCAYYPGFRWAEPDEEQLVELLRHVYAHPDEARAVGARAAEYAAAHLTWGHTAHTIVERLRQL
jgi:glycosyltransferase involved in cell wall biosynthesis